MKRAMRVSAWGSIADQGAVLHEGATHVRVVKLSQKPDEWAKPNKYARITCDLGTPASLLAGWLPSNLKHAMASVSYRHKDVNIRCYVSPDPVGLGELFVRMQSEPTIAFFSDDACASLPVYDEAGQLGLQYFNLDISSCDASCSEAVAHSLLDAVPSEVRAIAETLVAQLRAPCSLGFGSGRMLFRPKTIFEYSGSVLTTALNDVAMAAIAVHVADTWKPCSRGRSPAQLARVLRLSGWTLDVEACPSIEHVQFLKHSPAVDEFGQMGAVLNLGVLLRAIGRVRYDLPGRGDLRKRAYEHMCGVLRGFEPGGRHPLLEALQRNYPPGRQRIVPFYGYDYEGSSRTYPFRSLATRYSLDIPELEELEQLLSVAGFGDVVNCHASRVIMMRDYGY